MTVEPEFYQSNTEGYVATDMEKLRKLGAADDANYDFSLITAKLSSEARILYDPIFMVRAVFSDRSSLLIATTGWWLEQNGKIDRNLADTDYRIRDGMK